MIQFWPKDSVSDPEVYNHSDIDTILSNIDSETVIVAGYSEHNRNDYSDKQLAITTIKSDIKKCFINKAPFTGNTFNIWQFNSYAEAYSFCVSLKESQGVVEAHFTNRRSIEIEIGSLISFYSDAKESDEDIGLGRCLHEIKEAIKLINGNNIADSQHSPSSTS